MLERLKILVGGYNDVVFDVAVSFIPPTQNWSFEKSVKFYEELLEHGISELNESKLEEKILFT